MTKKKNDDSKSSSAEETESEIVFLQAANEKPFKVYCDDMFHYQDSSERMFVGAFATGREALEECKSILLGNLSHLYEPGMTSDDIVAKWWKFGEDPWISGPDGTKFSAATKAPSFAKRIIKQKENEN